MRALVCPAAAVAPLPGQLVEAELLSDGLRLPLLLLVLPLKPREQQLALVHARLRNRTRGRRIRTRRRRLRGLAKPRPRHLRGDSQSVSHSHTPRKKRVGDTGHLTPTSPVGRGSHLHGVLAHLLVLGGLARRRGLGRRELDLVLDDLPVGGTGGSKRGRKRGGRGW